MLDIKYIRENSEEIQKLTDQYIHTIEKNASDKEAEISHI